ncbi:hypothetical protein [[Mycoplasma] testudinis]|uniref:hypothetical protein n=1 Tax=[Mycoplasma] testudinis TaxID=33924 RepID=UPI000481FF71|nr:hypothetical protein [[Mycoplasma] testudinis]
MASSKKQKFFKRKKLISLLLSGISFSALTVLAASCGVANSQTDKTPSDSSKNPSIQPADDPNNGDNQPPQPKPQVFTSLDHGSINYDNSSYTKIASSYPGANDDYLYNGDPSQTPWTPQNGSIEGNFDSSAFKTPNPDLNTPQYNPNHNHFDIAVNQRDEIIASGFKLNPDSQPYKQRYNFWYNYQIGAIRKNTDISQSEPNDLAKAPQPLTIDKLQSIDSKIPGSFEKAEILKTAGSMDQADLQFNLDSLKHLLKNNEIGQNPSSFAWKLITLSNEIRLNKNSIISDNKTQQAINQEESQLRLFKTVPGGLTNVEFYVDNNDGINNDTGVIKLYVYYEQANAKKAFKIDLTPKLIGLKTNLDYIKTIADKTISLKWTYGGYNNSNPWSSRYQQIKSNIANWNSKAETEKTSPSFWNTYFTNNDSGRRLDNLQISGGTSWIVDRILSPLEQENPAADQEQYSFIMATNKHVADIGRFAGADPIVSGFNYNGFPDASGFATLSAWANSSFLPNLNNKYYAGRPVLTTDNFEQKYQDLPISEKEKADLLANWNDWKNNLIPKQNQKTQAALAKQKYWLANSGFDNFTWNRFSPANDDYSTVNNIPSSDIRTSGDNDSKANTDGYKYANQILYGDNIWNPVTNISVDYHKGNTEWRSSSQTMKSTYDINEFNFTSESPSWLVESRNNFIKSIIYAPSETIGHIDRNAGAQVGFNGGGVKRETNVGTYTNQLIGSDLMLLKMTFKSSDLKRDWKPLYDILHKDRKTQESWFNAMSATPRTDDRTATYVAGYPGASSLNGINRIFSYRVSNNTSTYTMDPTYGDSGTGSSIQMYYEKYNKDIWDKYYKEYAIGGKYNPGWNNFPFDEIFSNENTGLWRTVALAGTVFIQSGDTANPGNSGSMVIDANFNNFGILNAFSKIGGSDHSLVQSFVGLDPYSKSNVLSLGRMNIRLELEQILKDPKNPIKTFNLNS